MFSIIMALIFWLLYINSPLTTLETPLTGKDAFGIIILVLLVSGISQVFQGVRRARQ